MNKKWYAILFGLMIVFLTLESCRKGEVVISKEMQSEIDSLVNAQKDSIYLALDKICEERYDKEYEQVFDSIKQKRLEEISTIINQ